jgi:hypothetical protein
MDMGAFVVVINADQVAVTGKKATDKTYFRHVNARPGSWSIESFNQLQKVSIELGAMSTSGGCCCCACHPVAVLAMMLLLDVVAQAMQ